MAVRRTQEQRSQETTARIREAALALIADRGYANTSTTEIAARAGVSRGALLHHYPHKTDLVADVARHVWENASAHMRRISEEFERSREGVERFVEDMWASVFRRDAARMTLDLFSAARADDVLRQRLAGAIEDLFSSYARIADEAFRPSDLDRRERLAFVQLATSAMRGLRMQEMVAPDDAAIRAVRATLADVLWTALRERPDSPPDGQRGAR